MKIMSVNFILELHDNYVRINKDETSICMEYDEVYLLSLWLKEYLSGNNY